MLFQYGVFSLCWYLLRCETGVVQASGGSRSRQRHALDGDYTSIAGEVEILLGGAHSRDRITTYPFATLWPEGKHLPVPRATKGDVRIESDVWVGLAGHHPFRRDDRRRGCDWRLQPGCSRRAALRDCSGPSLPVIRMRFGPEDVETVLALRWWNWPRDVVVVVVL